MSTQKDRKIKVSELAEFDPAEFLETPQDIADYLTVVLEDGDAALLAAALGDIAKAKGMTSVAKDAGITREALYKALRADSSPRLETITRVLGAFGVGLVVKPVRRRAVKKTDESPRAARTPRAAAAA